VRWVHALVVKSSENINHWRLSLLISTLDCCRFLTLEEHCMALRMLLVGLIFVSGTIGCSRGPQVAEVEGNVKVKGQPIDKIRVEFWPEGDGPRSRGVTDSQGHFVLSLEDGSQPGAMVGSHSVILTDVGILGDKILGRAGENVDMAQGKKPRIASTYANPQTTLKKQVEAGKKNEIELEVDGPPAAR
jgi:hypothetical protein